MDAPLAMPRTPSNVEEKRKSLIPMTSKTYNDHSGNSCVGALTFLQNEYILLGRGEESDGSLTDQTTEDPSEGD